MVYGRFTRDEPDNMPNIDKLLTAEQLSQRFKGLISPERIKELCETKLFPHYEHDGGYLFGYSESLAWVNDNLLLHVAGNPIPSSVTLNPMGAPHIGTPEIPHVLRSISPYLISLPIQSLQHALWSGVYFLCKETEVVYVGQSIVVAGRVGAHMGDKDFDWAFCMRVPRSDLDFVEGEFIRALRPKYNFSVRGKIVCPNEASPRSAFASEVTVHLKTTIE